MSTERVLVHESLMPALEQELLLQWSEVADKPFDVVRRGSVNEVSAMIDDAVKTVRSYFRFRHDHWHIGMSRNADPRSRGRIDSPLSRHLPHHLESPERASSPTHLHRAPSGPPRPSPLHSHSHPTPTPPTSSPSSTACPRDFPPRYSAAQTLLSLLHKRSRADRYISMG